MDSTLPDAFEASQLESSAGHGLGAGAASIESMGSRNSFARGPYAKVDGMLVLRPLRYGHLGRWPLTFLLQIPQNLNWSHTLRIILVCGIKMNIFPFLI